MEKKEIHGNMSVAGLRRLCAAAKEVVGEGKAINIDLSIWHYDNSPTGSGNIEEQIGLYRSGGGPTAYVKSLKEAYEVLEEWKKGEM